MTQRSSAGDTPLVAGTAIRSRVVLARALDSLAAGDRHIGRALAQLGQQPLRWRGSGFPAMVSTILGQQVSLLPQRLCVAGCWLGPAP